MKQIIEYIQTFFIVVLVLIGVAGLAYRTFREDGWFGTAFARLWNSFFDYPLVAIPLAISVFVFGKLWNDHQIRQGQTSKLPNLFIYGVMAAGAYFSWHLVTQGTL